MRWNPLAAYRDHQAVRDIKHILLEMLRRAPSMTAIDIDERGQLATAVAAKGGNFGLLSRAAQELVQRYPQLRIVKFTNTLMLSRASELDGVSPDLQRTMRQTGALPTPEELDHGPF